MRTEQPPPESLPLQGKHTASQQGRVRLLPPLAKRREGTSDHPQNFDWHDVTSNSASQLYVSDNSQLCVRVLDPENGREIACIGRKGDGPGEFRFIARVRYDDAFGLAVIDNFLLRVTFFNRRGSVVATLPLDRMSDDIAWITGDTVVLSSFSLAPGYEPLRMVRISNGAVIREFGRTVEPQAGLRNRILHSPYAPQDMLLYSFAGMTRVLVVPGTQMFLYSQRHPYCLLFYRSSDHPAKHVEVALPFSVADSMEYTVNDGKRTATIHPMGVVLEPLYVELHRRLVVPCFNNTAHHNVLDVYDADGQFTERLQLPALEAGVKPLSAALVQDSVLAILVRDKDGICWIERISFSL